LLSAAAQINELAVKCAPAQVRDQPSDCLPR
jgi:hypothetical protein